MKAALESFVQSHQREPLCSRFQLQQDHSDSTPLVLKYFKGTFVPGEPREDACKQMRGIPGVLSVEVWVLLFSICHYKMTV